MSRVQGVGRDERRRIIVASLVGTTIEFFDFYIYATAAVSIFPLLFFPKGEGTAALLAAGCGSGVRRRHRLSASYRIAGLDVSWSRGNFP